MKKLLLAACCLLALCGCICGCMRKEETPAADGAVSQPVLSMQEEQMDLDSGDEGTVSEWGLTFTVRDATPTGATLIWEQSGGSPTGELETGSDFFWNVWRTENGKPCPMLRPTLPGRRRGILFPWGKQWKKQ